MEQGSSSAKPQVNQDSQPSGQDEDPSHTRARAKPSPNNPHSSDSPNISPNLDEQTRVRRQKLEKRRARESASGSGSGLETAQESTNNSAPEGSSESASANTTLRANTKAYPHDISVSHTTLQITEAYHTVEDASLLEKAGRFSLAGRVSFLRSFGKAGFIKIRDRAGFLQLHIAKDRVDAQSFEEFKELDLGDIVRAEGFLFRTKTGELTLQCLHFEILVKCLHAPPEKFHGLSNVEERYRRRYLDLMTSDETRKVFEMRSRIIQGIRDYFLSKAFIEVETPMMHPLVTGATARPFKTHHNTLDMELFLRIAPELYLKRLVVGGMERVFEVNRNFRNEGISVRHNPEFTMLEFYMSYATYHTLMDMTEELITELCEKLHGTTVIPFMDHQINLKKPWTRISMENAVSTMSGYQGKIQDLAGMKKYLQEGKGMTLTGREGPGALLTHIFEADVEKQLIQPTFVTSYPVEVSPLARRSDAPSPQGFDVTDRFELYVAGQEIANGFNELNDPDDQRERFEAQRKEKSAGNVEATDYDPDYILALEYGLPPTAGEGIGIDRLTMLLTNQASIRDVILFPQLKSESK